MAKISELTMDELVKVYVQLRDRRALRKKAFEMADCADKEKVQKIGGVILSRFRELGMESARTVEGTAYKHVSHLASIADRDIMRDQILKDPDNWALVTLMPNKAGIKQYIAEHGDLPPGINWIEELDIRVNRA